MHSKAQTPVMEKLIPCISRIFAEGPEGNMDIKSWHRQNAIVETNNIEMKLLGGAK